MSENIENGSKNKGPLDAARKFLMMLAVVTPAAIGTPQNASAEEEKQNPHVRLMEGVVGVFGDFSDAYKKLQEFNTRQLEEAKKLGPEVAQAFIDYQQIGELMGSSKMQLQRVEASLAEAQRLEASTDSLKGDLTQIFVEKNGVVPAAFIRQASVTIEQLKSTIQVQEAQAKSAGDIYFGLLDASEKGKKQ